jgi:hypothetical protein
MKFKLTLAEQFTLHWNEFVDRCSTHGIVNIKQNNTYFFKAIWLILFFSSFGFCFYLILKSINEYLNFQVTTKIKITSQGAIEFPTVKICYVNLFSTEYAKKFIDEHFNASGLKDPFNVTYLNKNDMASSLELLNALIEKNTYFMTEEEKGNINVVLSKMLISCNYGTIPCSAKNFTWINDPLLGSCYVFNSGKIDESDSKAPVLVSVISGPYDGLKIELLLPPAKVYYLDSAYGIQVYIGDSSIDKTQFENIQVAPGTKAIVGMKKTLSRALAYPFSECNQDPTYKQIDCTLKCFDLTLFRKCNCTDCTTIAQVDCQHQVSIDFFSKLILADECAIKCTPSCERTFYELSPSYLEYPSDNYVNNLIYNKDVLFKHSNYPISFEYLKRSMISLNFYYKNIEYTLIEESATMTEMDLISNVGGLLGKIKFKKEVF